MLVLIGNYIIWCEFASCPASGLLLNALRHVLLQGNGVNQQILIVQSSGYGTLSSGELKVDQTY